VSKSKKLDKASGFFFLAGFLAGKIRYLPLTIVSSILTSLSLALYLTGYTLWFIASHLYPEHAQHKDKWYGFAQFKEQNLLAAALGLIATVLSVSAIFFPILLIPAAWAFLASNSIWTIGEYHKLNNPHPLDETYSHTHQKSYLNYAITMTAIAAITAASTTLIFFFPPIAIPLLFLSTVVCLGLGAMAIESWLNFSFGNHKKTPYSESSIAMSQLGASKPLESTLELLDAPYHGASPLESPKKKPNQSLPIEPPSLSVNTCSVP
jgi:hypothetical protein